MYDADDLRREAHRLGEEVRYQRADAARTRRTDMGSLRAMEARLSAVWSEIRAVRATGPEGDPDRSLRRARPKWD
jgi:hypothetical protein